MSCEQTEDNRTMVPEGGGHHHRPQVSLSGLGRSLSTLLFIMAAATGTVAKDSEQLR